MASPPSKARSSSRTSSPPSGVSPETFRSVMGRFATGVTVVTASHRGRDAGMTVNAFLSVSLEPPTVLVALNAKADTTPLVEASHRFGVNLLSARQLSLSERFASRRPSSEKFEGVRFHRGPLGSPLLDGSLGSFECKVVQTVTRSTHRLFLGQVVAMEEGKEELPLVFWRSEYARPSQGGGLVMSPSRVLDRPSNGPARRPRGVGGPRPASKGRHDRKEARDP